MQYPDESSSNPSAIRIEDLLAGDDVAQTPPVREGLPRSFRMRADKHYVEMLDAQQPATGKDAAVPAPSPAVAPRTPRQNRDEEALAASLRADNELAQSLSALRASTNLLSDRGGLASTVAANLIRAESWRASCLLQVSRFLRSDIAPALKPVRVHAVVEQVLESIEAERRLRGIVIDHRMTVGDRRIATDEQLAVGALSGILMMLIARIESSEAVVTLSAESRGNDVAVTLAGWADSGLDWTRQATQPGFLRMLADIGGSVSMPEGQSPRLCIIFRAAPQ